MVALGFTDRDLNISNPSWNSGSADQLGGVNDPNGAYSFSTWIDSPTNAVIWDDLDGTSGVQIEVFNTSGDIRLTEKWNSGANTVTWTTVDPFSPAQSVANEVYHIAVTHLVSNDSSTSTDPVLYLNGSPVDLVIGGDLLVGIFEPPKVISAKFAITPAPSAETKIDEMAIWNAQLSAKTVNQIYNCSTDLSTISSANIVSYWRFGDDPSDTISTINDVVGNNDLTVNGAPATAFIPTLQPMTITCLPRSTGAKVSRGAHDSVFINRFAAPGGPETDGDSNGGPGLDGYSAEYSVYNSMNWRNPLTRKALRPLLSSHANQFGYFSSGAFSPGTIVAPQQDGIYPAGFYDAFPVYSQVDSSSVNSLDYSGTPNFHKVHRNVRRRMESGSIFTGSRFDNAWVTHPIPQSDLQYAWINASYESVDPSGLGYWYSDQFEFTTREAVVLQDPFTSSLNLTNWTSQKVTMRQSSDSDNWVARMGTLLGVNDTDPRLLTTVNDYKLPFRIDYSYARGGFQNPASRLYLEFDGLSNLSGTAAAVSSSEGKSSISFWLKADERCFTDPPSTRHLFIFDKFARKSIYLTGAPAAALKYERKYTAGANDKVSEIGFYALANPQFPSSSLIDDFVHFCIVDDETDPEYETKIYANGVNYARQVFTASGDPEPIEDEFIIGNTATPSTFSFTGSMDSISWFNKLLTEAEVQELYNGGTPGNVQNISFWPTSITASNQVHYWQLGDANADEILLGTPPATNATSAYDYGTIPAAYEADLFAYGTGDMQFLEYPGYNMASPDASAGETMSLELSTDAGVTWQTASILDDDYTSAGKFIGRSYTFRESAPGQTGRIRFRQNNYANPKRDNWAVNDVTISQISYVDPVTFSPYSDFWSRISGTTDTKFGNSIAEIEADPRLTASLPTVYNGLNYNIYEPIDAGNEFLGYNINASYTFGGETGNVIQYLNTTTSPDGFASGSLLPSSTELSKSVASLTNAILLKRNGPYGYPIWKQTRTAEHALARYYRNNNIYNRHSRAGRDCRHRRYTVYSPIWKYKTIPRARNQLAISGLGIQIGNEGNNLPQG